MTHPGPPATDLIRRLTAEFLGSFGLVFIAAGAVVVDASKGGTLGLTGMALAQGAVLAVMSAALVGVSGAHFNPAVTFALWMSSRMRLGQAVAYAAIQLAAAVLAALSIKWLAPAMAGEITGYGVPRIAGDVTLTRAIVIEALLTFFWVSAVLGISLAPGATRLTGIAVGLVLLFDVLVGSPLTGAAMNPARAFGPALTSGEWHGHAAYWIGPALGAAVGAVLWGKILLPVPRREEGRGKREE